MTEERSGRETELGGPSEAELNDAVPPAGKGRELRVGIFVLLGILASVAVLFITTDPGTFRGRYIVTTTMSSAGGVRAGDPVQMRGVNIGRVKGFALTRDAVRISLEIEGEWEIPADSRTRLSGLGILSGRTVEVIPGDASRTLEPGENLPGASGRDVNAAIDSASADVEVSLNRLRELLAEPTVRSVRESVQEVNGLLAEMSTLTREQRAELNRLTESLNRSARNLETVTDASPEAARAVARADSALARINAAGGSLEGAAASLETILARLESGEGTLGQLARNDSLYVNLNRAIESIHLLASDVRENPGRYVKVEIF